MVQNIFAAFFILMIIFSGCAKAPEKSDIEETLSEITSELEAVEKAAKCGDGIKDEWEECDSMSNISCSEDSPEKIGPIVCNSCKIDFSGCIEQTVCDIEICTGNGECIENNRTHYLQYCKCFEGFTGDTCTECAEDYHFDIDGKCISDMDCTLAGCVENSKCEIFKGYAKCVCDYPYSGENCDNCKVGYYFEDGTCKGAFCFHTSLKCTKFEKCNDSSGKPICVCAGANQDPVDCSKCLSGYGWYNSSCLKETWVPCSPNLDKPENSVDLIKSYLITYTDEGGWSEPEDCDWECMEGTFFNDGNCQKIEIFYSDDLEIPFGFDNLGQLIAGNKEGDVLILSSTEIIERTSYGIQFTNGRIGADGNIYFRMLSGYGVLNYETGSYFMFQKEIMRNPITLSKDGTVFFGDTYFDFPDLIPVSLDFQNRYAVTITDQEGNTLTVYQDGYVILLDINRDLLWSRQFDDYNFTAFPAINKAGLAFLPCYIESQGRTSGLIIDLNNGESIRAPELYSGFYLEHAPAISIDSDYRKVVSDSGVLKVYDSDNKFLYDTSSISFYSPYTENIPPVLSDEGLIYFANDHHILAFRESDKKMWSFNIDIDAIPRVLIHKDQKLYVFTSRGELHILYAPGKPEGNWPQMLHDSQLTGSIAYTPEFKRPVAPTLGSPENSSVFNTDSVTFSWQADSEDTEIKYTLLLRDSTGYDKVYAGPAKGLTTATIEGLADGAYEWRVVSQDSNGSLNVSDARIFTIE